MLAGKEVPIIGSDAINWIELSVPAPSHIADAPAVDGGPTTVGLSSDDRASCFVIGDPSTYLIWFAFSLSFSLISSYASIPCFVGHQFSFWIAIGSRYLLKIIIAFVQENS